MTARHAGVNLPLFSLRSEADWGIGEITDLGPFAAWLARARIDRLLLLPLGTMQHGQSSPYAALSTVAIDPIYIGVGGLADFARAGGLEALSADAREALDEARQAPQVQYGAVRRAKAEALRLAFDSFLHEEWEQLTPRAADLAAYVARERWWLDDYALFQALSHHYDHAAWFDWPAPVRTREPHALDEARRQRAHQVLEQQYYQWIAEQQWQEARSVSRGLGVALFGDLPFVAGSDSPEIWARPGEFMLDVSTGVPPDAFSATGQDWGLPTYRWEAIRAGDYDWLRHRSRRMAELYDGIRIDHTIGLYRTYGRPASGEPFFTPADEADQIAQGEQIMRILKESGLALIAEDLGSVPDFLRASLARLEVPGCKVLRWEREWKSPGQPFIQTEQYPPLSAAMTGTHDTEPLSVWWDQLPPPDRSALLELPLFPEHGIVDAAEPWNDRLRDAFLDLAYRAGSAELFVPVQDLFGWRDRINLPGTVGPHNWVWRLPWTIEELGDVAEARERVEALDRLALAAGRAAAAEVRAGRPD